MTDEKFVPLKASVLAAVLSHAKKEKGKARALRLPQRLKNGHGSNIVLQVATPKRRSSGGFLCLFTNIFAKSVARVSPSQCQSASTTKNGLNAPVATAPKWSSEFSPFSRRHREKADESLGRKGFHGHCFSAVAPRGSLHLSHGSARGPRESAAETPNSFSNPSVAGRTTSARRETLHKWAILCIVC